MPDVPPGREPDVRAKADICALTSPDALFLREGSGTEESVATFRSLEAEGFNIASGVKGYVGRYQDASVAVRSEGSCKY